MAEIRWTSEAATWLEDIHDYIAQEDPSAAARVVQGIYDRVQSLGEFPDLGQRCRSEPEGDVRILLFGHYRIAYLRYTAKQVVDILGVFHDALDIDRYL
ncbi:MAG: type II toxin-antitoxin system RelE/ParE family toxin [Armatimonadetes bacterium]|nr:type II toxin-antitoxin system RelE/ParE family toxin [Armatimonadota bacterium]